MKTYQVGGCVRDQLMGVIPHDYDYLVVGTTSEEMLARGFKQVGADFPVFLNEAGDEYALARTEKKTGPGYNGFETRFTPDVTIEEDLKRRDLTINSMAFDQETGSLIDPFNGSDDIKNKILRHTSEAFVEDPVRVLRLGRFWARLGPAWSISDVTVDLCSTMAKTGECSNLTRERVLKELLRALEEPYPKLFFFFLSMIGLPLKYLDKYIYNNINGASKELALAMILYHVSDIEKFLSYWKVPSDLSNYAIMYRKAREQLGCTDKVEALYRCGAYRRQDLFCKMIQDIVCHGQTEFKTLALYFEETKDIGFNNINSEGLVGIEIANEIKQARKRKANELS
jgi:tRNA nucleotidyltransferase/poly(A) polymerase